MVAPRGSGRELRAPGAGDLRDQRDPGSGPPGAQLFMEAGGALPAGPVLDLRAAAQRALHQKFGSLEAFAATLGPPPPPLGAGRAGARVALVAQIARAWRAQFPA